MGDLDVLIDIIILLYFEYNKDRDSVSKDLVTETLSIIENKNNNNMDSEKLAININLINYIKNIIDNDTDMDKNELLTSLSLIILDSNILDLIKQRLEDNEKSNIIIIRLRRKIKNYINNYKLKKLFNKYYKEIFKKNGNLNKNKIINNIKEELDKLSFGDDDDPSILEEISFDNPESINGVIEDMKKEAEMSSVFKSGWQDMNVMLQGGFRRGELAIFSALQHKYKSGMLASIFIHLLLFNEPDEVKEEGKKPLIIFYGLEDPLKNTLGFIYNYLYLREYGKLPDILKIDPNEINKFIVDRLTVNGFSVKILKVNPDEWSYRGVFNSIEKYENEGYEVQAVVMDYLGLVPTIGCTGNGTVGSELTELYRRIKNFFAAKKISIISAHQLSRDATNLLRNGVPGIELVNYVVNKNYYKGSTQIGQEIDLEIHQHLVTIGDKTYLTIRRGKHRLPVTIPEKYQYFILPFPEKGPILDDIESDKKISMYSIDDNLDDDFGL